MEMMSVIFSILECRVRRKYHCLPDTVKTGHFPFVFRLTFQKTVYKSKRLFIGTDRDGEGKEGRNLNLWYRH